MIYNFNEALALLSGHVAARTGNIHKALSDLVSDLEQRSYMKLGDDKGVVDCGHGVYIRAKDALAAL